jgi:hypothetical protein
MTQQQPWTAYCLRCQQGFEQEEQLGNRSDWADRFTLWKAG